MENKRNHKYPEETFGFPSEKSSRTLALQWWRKLMDGHKVNLMFEYKITGFTYRDPNTLTGSEIEKIYVKETTDLEEIADSMRKSNEKQLKVAKQIAENSTYGADSKNHPINGKQFVEFNPELFKAYISKFSEEDKLVALRVLYKSFPDSPLKNHISKWFE
jgi:hypothetical protein